MDLLIKNAKIIDVIKGTQEIGDLLVRNGKIALIAKNINAENVKLIDASGLSLASGLVDLHTHLRDPGFTNKEDIISGCNAAAAGGITSLCAMPNTNPVTDNAQTISYILDKAKNAKARVLPIAAITKGLLGQELTDVALLKKAGAKGFSDDGVPVKTADLMQKAMTISAELNMPILAHCEEKSLAKNGIINDGKISKQLCVEGIPNSAEDVGTAREIALLMSAPKNARLHICHVSTKQSAELIRNAKKKGYNITAETGAHYFTFNEEMVLSKDADYRMNPPLRSEEDRIAIENAVIDGTIDAIATDHAPHTAEEKSDFMTAPNGVIGMETSFSASYTSLVSTGKMTMLELIKKMSYIPAKIIGIDAGTLEIGKTADLVLIDENECWKVDVSRLHGKSTNCIFKNQTLKSKVKLTVLGGEIVFNDNLIIGEK
ncbi:MAG: dihydroorotase [Oscillospiraceae bacterium]